MFQILDILRRADASLLTVSYDFQIALISRDKLFHRFDGSLWLAFQISHLDQKHQSFLLKVEHLTEGRSASVHKKLLRCLALLQILRTLLEDHQ